MKTREDAVRTLEGLIASLNAHPDEWENPTLERYLDAMAAWLDSARVRQMQEPSWELFCQALEAAKVYE